MEALELGYKNENLRQALRVISRDSTRNRYGTWPTSSILLQSF